MKTIKTAASSKVLNRTLRELKVLIPKLRDHTEVVARKVHTALEIDREVAMPKIIEMGLPLSMIKGLDKVGAGRVHVEVFLNGTATASMAEVLKFKDQKLLVEKGVSVVVGGTVKEPEVQVMTMRQIPNRLAAQVIYPKEQRIRTVAEQIEFRSKQTQRRDLGRYEVKDGHVIFHVRKWPIAELKTIVGNI